MSSHFPTAARSWARDGLGAIALAEGAVAERIFTSKAGFEPPGTNVFGARVQCEKGDDVAALLRRAGEAAVLGSRVAVVAPAVDLASARSELSSIASRGLGMVVHAIAEPAPLAADAGTAPVMSLSDLPWGMVMAAGVADALDLALVARRAAEDSGCPFFVVHERSLVHHVEPLSPPSSELCEAFLGRASSTAREVMAAGTESAFAERAPFALSSAMREYEALTARRHDVIERVPNTDCAVALLGIGALGDSLLADIERLRAAGHDVGALRVVAWRPFPGARLVKALSRALAITVLESVDHPLAPGGPLSMQLKAAFADALTWAPDYPGVGRIPRIISGTVSHKHEVSAGDLDAAVHNMLADERGKRSFVLGGNPAGSIPAPSVTRTAGQVFAVRGVVAQREVALAAADLGAAVIASTLGVRTRIAVRSLPEDEGGGFVFDLRASRERPRGSLVPHSIRVIVLDDPGALSRGNPLSRISPGGLLAVPTAHRSADALWAEVPSWAKAIVFDRGVRVVGWSALAEGERSPWVSAAALVGVALFAAARDRALTGGRTVDGSVVAREVGEALRAAGTDAATEAERGARAARDAFEAQVEIPRATIEREDDGVRLGRRDSRASTA